MNEPREGDPGRAAERIAALKASLESKREESGRAEAALAREVEFWKEKAAEIERLASQSKKKKTMGSLQDLKTPMKARLRSKPKVEGQEYLDMYVMTRDRARWERMEKQSAETLLELEKDMRDTEKTLPGFEYTRIKQSSGSAQRGPKPIRPMKTMPLDY